MLGNRGLQAGVTNVTATGTTTLGFAPGNTSPADLVTVSASGAATIALPVIALTTGGIFQPSNGTLALSTTSLGAGGNQLFRVMNLAAQSVAVAAGGSDSIVGNTGTIAQNTTRTLISNSANNTWYAF